MVHLITRGMVLVGRWICSWGSIKDAGFFSMVLERGNMVDMDDRALKNKGLRRLISFRQRVMGRGLEMEDRAGLFPGCYLIFSNTPLRISVTLPICWVSKMSSCCALSFMLRSFSVGHPARSSSKRS